jgi:hypothetical protein
MILFFLLLLDPSSFLDSRGPGCAVPSSHVLSASAATAILARTPLFVSDEPAEEAEDGEWAPWSKIRDSGKYLHDARTKTLHTAMIWHAREGARSTRHFHPLTGVERLQL